ncbi:AFR396Wp [Eremothecium gossypii ATCC 10895]|uniref:AFR396Wp n=1 Tax=Eremothecium gossypii (strain ATCC 10895 / CBS 109.51 / FGSC 9923 / NRRL Y-1056) TaxID=284811 RepID=Q753C0_EREGS|nr:AFR396Wp [Eremothecium gossypii ATCC 10895]AAS53767.1 AFR396Wp [Eremothecium gossypii ATCC 10895]AEY98079.1 FAFR396Wp [Eremothecium gossypii FDAG1]
MLNEQEVLQAFERTMASDAGIIKEAEQQLFVMQRERGFTSFLISAAKNEGIPLNIRLSCSIYLKNKIQRSWRSRKDDRIAEEEEGMIKEQLLQALIENSDNSHIRPHLTESIRGILAHDERWQLADVVLGLLGSGKAEYVYPGLLLVFEVAIKHRYVMSESRDYIDGFIEKVFPQMEEVASQLVNNVDYHSSELLYLILKSFKYACLNNFPRYFTNVEKLNSWIQLHLFLCSRSLPKEVLELDPSDRSLDKRVKVNKWAFGNLNKFVHKYTRVTKFITADFVQYVFQEIVPTIISEYFKVIELWGNSSLWLGDGSLYYLIQFLEKCLKTEELWPLIQPHLGVIIKHVIFPCLSASDQSIELLQDDPEEYTRRYFDMNKEGSTADVASSEFIFVIGHSRFEEVNKILPLIHEVFTEFAASGDLASAYKEEGALRLFSNLSSFLAETDSPVREELEPIFQHFITPLLGNEKYPFLVARALETIAIYQQEFKNMEILSKIFELSYLNLMHSETLPVQIEAADALKTLVVSNPSIHKHIAPQVPGIMEKLLKLSKEFEIDILSEVMEALVERFSDELTPFANELAETIAEQFLRLGQSLVENTSGHYSTQDQDQETQASAMLQTMTTMVMSMNKVCLVEKFAPVVKFIIVNAQISFLTEMVDLIDSLALSAKAMYNTFTPVIWELFHDVLDSFQTYALEYFEAYQVFFESVVTHGFPQDQTFVEPFLQVVNQVLDSEDDFDIESAFSILIAYALSMKDIPLFAKAFEVAQNQELEIDDSSIVRLFLSGLYAKPLATVQLVEQQGITLALLKKWLDCKFYSVYTTKLQLMALLSLFGLPELPSCLNAFVGPLVTKLVNVAEYLPEALRKRDCVAKGELAAEDDTGAGEFFDELEDDFKESCLDNVNCFNEFHAFFTSLQQREPAKYQTLLAAMDSDTRDSFCVIMDFVTQTNKR